MSERLNTVRRAFAGAALATILVLLSACGSHAGTTQELAASGGFASQATTAGGEGALSAAPPTEGTGPESPQQVQNGTPALQLASLPTGGGPIGGNGDLAQQCASVAWVGSNPLPDGIRIELGEITFDPSGVFTVGGDACPSDLRPCAGAVFAAGEVGCAQPVIQHVGASGRVSLVVPATVRCANSQVCAEFAQVLHDLRGVRVGLTAVPLVPTGGHS